MGGDQDWGLGATAGHGARACGTCAAGEPEDLCHGPYPCDVGV